MKTENDIVDYRMRLSTGRGRIMEGFRLMTKLTLWKGVVLVSYGLKRIIDIAAASVALTLGSPLFALTAILIKFEDGGAVLFRQERVGYRGKCFGMYKFRSMRTQAESETKSLEAQNEMQGGVIFKMTPASRVLGSSFGSIRSMSFPSFGMFWWEICRWWDRAPPSRKKWNYIFLTSVSVSLPNLASHAHGK